MITKLEEYLDIFYEQDFYDVAISAKSMDAQIVIDAYTEISKRFDHPLHLGVTHAGPKETGDDPQRRGAGRAAGQRHRRHDPHQLRQRPDLRGAGRAGAAVLPRPARAHRRGPDRVPDVRAHPGGPVHAGAGCPQAARGEGRAADQGRGDGVHRERPRRGRGRGRRGVRGRPPRHHLRAGREGRQRARRADPRAAAGRVPRVPGQGRAAARPSWARRRWTSFRRTRSASWARGSTRSRAAAWRR